MYSYKREDLIAAFSAAPNINSALKGFLKHEVTKGDQSAKFVKAFRVAATAKNPEQFVEFVQKALPRYERHFFLIARHAYSAEVEPMLDVVIDQYAEEFNQSYDGEGENVSVTDRKKFDSIAKSALQALDGELEKSSMLPNNNFMRNMLVFSLFEEGVIKNIPTGYFD